MNTVRNSKGRAPLQHVDQNINHLNAENPNILPRKNIYPSQQQYRGKRRSALNNKENQSRFQQNRKQDCKQISNNDIKQTIFQKLTTLVANRQHEDVHKHQHQEEYQDTVTPSTGNTPLLNTKITPKISIHDGFEYTQEFITEVIGKDTLRTKDYLITLFNEEKRNNAHLWYNAKVSSSDTRSDAIDWLCFIGEEFELARSTIYLSIYYFDKICSEKEVNTYHIQMVAASCLLIAIKYKETEDKVPSLYKLSAVCNKQYAPKEFKPMELKILNLLSFELKVVLPIYFINYHIDIAFHGCVFDDDTLGSHRNLHINEQTNTYLHKFAKFFSDMLCQNYTFYKYLPSIIASAVIIASRRALKIEPYLNSKLLPSLWNTHRYPATQIKQCFEELWDEYREKFAEDAQTAEELQPKHMTFNTNQTETTHAMDID